MFQPILMVARVKAIREGVACANRLARLSTLWGWKGSGSTGKAIGSTYYLPLYLREQSQTVVE
jgi:hypothetical protein